MSSDLLEAVILLDLAVAAHVRIDFGLIEQVREIEALAPSSDRSALRASSMSARPTISSIVRKPSCAMISRSSCAMKRMKLTTCSGLPVELLAQLRILRGDADRAGVQVADAHHDAADRDERRGGEAEFLGAEQRGDRRRRGRS